LCYSGGFFLLLVIAGYAGLSAVQVNNYGYDNFDKVLHLGIFFLLTLVFYWILDTTRRRTLHLTLVVCTGVLGVGSEFLQGFLANGREFDLYDLIANVMGSLVAIGLCSWYHKRMLERKRQKKGYGAVPGEDGDEEDVELGVMGAAQQEEGVAPAAVDGPAADRTRTLEEEVDNWDENAVDAWDECVYLLRSATRRG
jgi:VanZ family protein